MVASIGFSTNVVVAAAFRVDPARGGALLLVSSHAGLWARPSALVAP
jgi:hypothetical protein